MGQKGKGAGGKAKGKGMPPAGMGKAFGKGCGKDFGQDFGMDFGKGYGKPHGKMFGGMMMGGKGFGMDQGCGYGDRYGPPSMAPGWGFAPQAMQPKAPKWAAAAASPTADASAHWIAVDETSQLAQQGLPLEAPVAIYEKGVDVFSSSSHIISDIVGDVSAEVTITHDADWEQFPDIGEAIKAATGEEHCFAVATCPNSATWGVGVANGWKGRESAAKVALALALAAQNPQSMGTVARNYPEFGALCQSQGFNVKAAGAQAKGGKGKGGKQAAHTPAVASPEIPAVHFLTVGADSKPVLAGLPTEAYALAHSKQMKEYFSNAHNILSELVEDVSTAVTFEDDPEWKEMPEVGAALTEAGAEENSYCIASCSELACWGVGLSSGWKGRESAAKLALAMAIMQGAGRLEEFATNPNYPEFGALLSAAGLVEMPQQKKRRKGGW
jgi:hypothetical protein